LGTGQRQRDPKNGYEVVVKFHSPNITNNGTFYTDSNGLQMQKRVLNEQSSYKLRLDQRDSNTTENYYPITSAIAIRDENI